MKIKNTYLLIGLLAASASTTVNANDNPWYAGINVSQVELDNINTDSNSPVGGVTRRIGIETDDESGFGITLGRTLFTSSNGNSLSVELNYSNTDYDVENIRFMNNDFFASEGRSEGSAEVETILARVKYQFSLGDFKPYVGLGIGQSDFNTDGRYGMSVGSASGSQPPFINGDDSATAVEVRAGLAYQFNDNFEAFIEYTTTDVDDVEFSRRGGGPGGLATTTQSGDFSFDAVNLGLNVRF